MILAFRRTLKVLLCMKPVNAVLRMMSPLLRRVLPIDQLSRVPIVGPITVDYDGWQPIRMSNNGSDSIATRIFWRGKNTFDRESIELFLMLARHSRVVLDIGANTGIYSLLTARNNPSVEVYAFEPVPKIRNLLEGSAVLNHTTNLTISGLAISDFVGKSEFFVPCNFAALPTSASLNREFRNDSAAVPVEVITVDEFVRLNEVCCVDLMKIDTESTELTVLSGAANVLAQYRPFIICEILKTQNPLSFKKMLDPLNYNYFWVTTNGLVQRESPSGDREDKDFNYLFIPAEKLPLLKDSSVKLHLL